MAKRQRRLGIIGCIITARQALTSGGLLFWLKPLLTCETWWRLFDYNAERLDDLDYLSRYWRKSWSPIDST
jgi:hypothetical protein